MGSVLSLSQSRSTPKLNDHHCCLGLGLLESRDCYTVCATVCWCMVLCYRERPPNSFHCQSHNNKMFVVPVWILLENSYWGSCKNVGVQEQHNLSRKQPKWAWLLWEEQGGRYSTLSRLWGDGWHKPHKTNSCGISQTLLSLGIYIPFCITYSLTENWTLSISVGIFKCHSFCCIVRCQVLSPEKPKVHPSPRLHLSQNQ